MIRYGNKTKKRKYLGLFETKELAYSSYKKASKELHGDFSNI